METKFSQWLKRVGDTRDDEIDCASCLDQIARYVEIELATGRQQQELALVAHHLAQCPVCHEEYELLRELAVLEASGEQPDIHDLSRRLTQEPEKRD